MRSSTPALGKLAEQRGSTRERQRIGWVHRQLGERHRRHDREGVHGRPQVADGPQQGAALALAAEEGAEDDAERPAPNRLGHVRRVRELQQRRPGHHLLRQPGGELGPGVENLSGALEGEEHRARVQVLDGVDVELDRGDDAKVPIAAAQRPEEIGLVLRVDPRRTSVRGHELDRGDAVRLQAVLAGEPAHAPAQRVAGDADVGGGAVQRGQPELGELRDDPLPFHPGPDPDAPGAGVDRDLLEVAHVDEKRVLERAERRRVVPGGLRRHSQPVGLSVVDGGDDVGRVAWEATTAAGRRSVDRLKTSRVASQSGSDGVTTRPVIVRTGR